MTRVRLAILVAMTASSGLALAQAVAIGDDHISWRTVGMGLLGVVCTGLSAAFAYVQGKVSETSKDLAALRLEVAKDSVTGLELKEAVAAAFAPIVARLDTLEALLMTQASERTQEARRARRGG